MKLHEIMADKELEVVKSDQKEITLQDKKTKVKTVVPSNMIKKNPENPQSDELVLSKNQKPTTSQQVRPGQKVKVTDQ